MESAERESGRRRRASSEEKLSKAMALISVIRHVHLALAVDELMSNGCI